MSADALLDTIQYPAAVLSLAGAWLVADERRSRRHLGFGLWIISNLLWVAWGSSTLAWGLLATYIAYFITSVRGWASTGEEDTE
jgi:hypothetical protein